MFRDSCILKFLCILESHSVRATLGEEHFMSFRLLLIWGVNGMWSKDVLYIINNIYIIINIILCL